jgi:arylformamidase
MDIVDLSMPIGPHFRWSPELRIKGDISGGDQFRVSHLATTCHGFSHVDAQAHFVAHAPTIEATPLARVVGRRAC